MRKKQVKKTGGGSLENKIDELSLKIINLLPQQMYGLHNEYDDDNVSFIILFSPFLIRPE